MRLLLVLLLVGCAPTTEPPPPPPRTIQEAPPSDLWHMYDAARRVHCWRAVGFSGIACLPERDVK